MASVSAEAAAERVRLGLLFPHGRLRVRFAVTLGYILARLRAAVGRAGAIAALAARLGLMPGLVRGRLARRGKTASGRATVIAAGRFWHGRAPSG